MRMYSFLFLCSLSLFAEEKPFVVIICSRNNEVRVEKNLESVFTQKYSNYRVIYIDDASTDKTANCVKNYLKAHNCADRCTFISNTERMYKMHNLYHAVHSCKNHEIVVELDGDDFFAHDGVLSYLNEIYKNKDIWLTYGGIITEPRDLEKMIPRKMPEEFVKKRKFREIMFSCWNFLALRSFYAGLFKRIRTRSLQYKNKFFSRGSDMLQMMPMFEMAGERFHFIDQTVYVYNVDTGQNDWKEDSSQQSKASLFSQQKKRYQRLKKAPFTQEC